MSAAMPAGDHPVRNVDSPEAVDALVAELLDEERQQPIVAVTSRQRERHPAMDVDIVREIVGEMTDVVFLVDGPLTRQLSERLPNSKMGVFGGAARIWWPGLTAGSKFDHHPLIFDPHAVYGSQAEERLERAWREGPPLVGIGPVDDPELHLLRERHRALESAFMRQRDELHVAEEEIRNLREQIAAARQRAREQRPVEPARRIETAPDPELAFRVEVLTAWHEHFPVDQSDRERYPLARYRLLSGWMDDIDALQPADRAKLPEVVAMVLCGRVRDINGMEDHQLRSGSGGSGPQRVRSSDGALARRTYVRRDTPNAARLHYWVQPDGTIDLASVRGHDYVGIPES